MTEVGRLARLEAVVVGEDVVDEGGEVHGTGMVAPASLPA
jgi:hypothetical protein